MAAPFSDSERAYLRRVMGYSKLFTSSNAIFENILNEIQDPNFDDGSTIADIRTIMAQLQSIDQQRLNNIPLGLATEITAEVRYDAARNDAFLKNVGRSYIKQLAIIFSMKPAQDYYGRARTSTSGNIYPQGYSFDSSDQVGD